MADASIPTPGSLLAIASGCTCPQIDNHYGAGIPQSNGETFFWIDAACPVHGEEESEA